jgi:adenylate cyclase
MCVLFGQVAALVAIQYFHPDWITEYASSEIRRADLIFSFSLVAVFMLGYVGINTYNLDERRKVADGLLLNILPDAIATKLKYSSTQVVAEDHPNASVLFADIVEFTPMSANLTPRGLVELLNAVFSYFDGLADHYGVEKIKTIGDCYMVAAGVPSERANHAAVLTRLALDMQEYVFTHDFAGKRLQLRIGINSGPVIAGVIGHKKFSYDMWGDTVNIASRMESHGQAGAIQVTRSTYELIKGDFVCRPEGCINVKGKGEMEVWHVVAVKG